MEFRRWVFGIAVAIFSTLPLYAMASTQAVVSSKNISIYFPPKYQSHQRYPFILALGDRRQGVLTTPDIWRPIAQSMNHILVCVADDEVVDRKLVVAIRDYMDRMYRVDASTSMVVGIGASGSIAMESALLAPRKIRNVMAFYGHFDPKWDSIIRKSVRNEEYKYSSVVLITVEGDPSQNALSHAADQLRQLGIGTELKVYPKPQLGYPDDLQTMVSQICDKVAENASKENRH